MLFMNSMDIDDAVQRYSNNAVLGKAARFLAAFRDEVDAHSDGWAYWPLPARAAKDLMEMLTSPATLRGQADLTAALKPIKAFYKRRGYAAGMRYPSV